MEYNNQSCEQPLPKSADRSTGTFVLGICSVLAQFIIPAAGPFIGLICGIVGIVLANRQRRSAVLDGLGQTGLVLSIVGTAIGAVRIVLFFVIRSIAISLVSGLIGAALSIPWHWF